MQTVEGEHDIFGDGRVTLVPLPGHTPGTMGVHAVLDRSGAFRCPPTRPRCRRASAGVRRRGAPGTWISL